MGGLDILHIRKRVGDNATSKRRKNPPPPGNGISAQYKQHFGDAGACLLIFIRWCEIYDNNARYVYTNGAYDMQIRMCLNGQHFRATSQISKIIYVG